MNSAAPVVPLATVAGEQLLDAVDDQRPVRQPGQRVVQRLVTQLPGPLTDQLQRPRPRRCRAPTPAGRTADWW